MRKLTLLVLFGCFCSLALSSQAISIPSLKGVNSTDFSAFRELVKNNLLGNYRGAFSPFDVQSNLLNLGKTGITITPTEVQKAVANAQTPAPTSDEVKRSHYSSAAIYITKVFQFSKDMKGLAVVGQLETTIGKDTNVFAIEDVRKTWDMVGDGSSILGSATAVAAALWPNASDSDKIVATTIGVGLGSALKFLFSRIAESQSISYIAISRQAYDDIKSRLDGYTDIGNDFQAVVDKLSPIDDAIGGADTSDLDRYVKILTDSKNVDAITSASASLLQLKDTYVSFLNSIQSQVNYYNSTLKDRYGKSDARFSDLQTSTTTLLAELGAPDVLNMFTVLENMKGLL